MRPSYARVDHSALRHNFRWYRERSRADFICPMVKANAYGHGVVEVSRSLLVEGAATLGVALFEEALELREAGFTEPDILVFSPLLPEALPLVLEHGLSLIVTCARDLDLLKDLGAHRPVQPKMQLKVHLKVNLGMSRLGFDLKDAPWALETLSGMAGVQVVGLCGHLANGKDVSQSTGSSAVALARLQDFAAGLPVGRKPRWIHALNSESVAASKETDGMATVDFSSRPGIGLYGFGAPDLRPVLSVHSKIVQSRWIEKGEGVSYGPSWRAARKTLVGVIPLGYADGLRRSASNKVWGVVAGKAVQGIGTICMDYAMFDLTDAAAGPGDDFTLCDTATLAEIYDTIPYEVLTGFSTRLRRVHK
jgi:alanine racemase